MKLILIDDKNKVLAKIENDVRFPVKDEKISFYPDQPLKIYQEPNPMRGTVTSVEFNYIDNCCIIQITAD